MRLTNDIRHLIIKNAINDAFAKREARNKNEEYKLAFECRDKQLGKYKDVFLKMPRYFVPRDYYVRVNIDGQRIDLGFDNKSTDHPCPTERLVLKPTSPLAKKVMAWTKEREAIKVETIDLRSKIRSLVYSVTTDKKLLEVWPEAKPYISTMAVETYALAVRPEDINKQIAKAKAA